MTTTFDIYGIREKNIDRVAEKLADTLTVDWTPRHSLYLGDYFQYGRTGRESFRLQLNCHDLEDEWMLPQHKEYPTLLYVNHTDRAKQIEELLAGSEMGITLLRCERKEDLER